ncbi:MAG: IMP cyclohydrolase [Verrucomicrobiota bacterium]|nr:IMP cyclohydrolase [Verrucomicrobiota bacterium]
MYVGRIVSVCMTKDERIGAMYRVSSRSFPNREAKLNEKGIAILPKAGFENDIYKNPYIAYNCLRITADIVVATNGAQTDPITEKIDSGMSIRDALITCTFALDYEHDQLDTPRISSVVDRKTRTAYLGIVRKDALLVKEIKLEPGNAYYVATYEHNEPSEKYFDTNFDVKDADTACDYILGQGVFADLEKPVTSAVAIENTNGGFDTAIKNA